MNRMRFYLRIEGVNIGSFIYDTQDLSTIRGGSLLLLDAAKRIPDWSPDIELQPISTGASSGIFAFEATGPEAADQLRQDIQRHLNDDPRLRHATFVVDQIAASDRGFAYDRERLLALNRWRQMRSPSIAPVDPEIRVQDSAASDACSIDGLRPAAASMQGPEGEVQPVSASVRVRREFGRQQKKRDFYREYAGERTGGERRFVHDLSSLTECDGNPLSGKLAVLYLDGNGFGKIQNSKCRSEALQSQFDSRLQSLRRSLLRDFLEWMDRDPGWRTPQPKNERRIETLLWGGDEIIWALPAWKGWDTLDFFFRRSADWEFEGEGLTHAAGLVLCSHKAPIHRIVRLARELAELAKERSRRRSLFAYQVLETFDHTGDDLQRYRRQRCPEGQSPHGLILEGESLGSVADWLPFLREGLPRRQLHSYALALIQGDPSADGHEQRLLRSLNDLAAEGKLLRGLERTFGPPPWCWLHLAELWDYLPQPGDLDAAN